MVITGQGSLWMYAHAAAVLAVAGATSITAQGRGAPGTSTDVSRSRCTLTPADGSAARALLDIHMPREPPLAESAVYALLLGPLEELARLRPHELCVTGRAPGLAYALAAEHAVVCGAEWLTCWSPRDGVIVVFDRAGSYLGQRIPAPEWLDGQVPVPAATVIVGVIGDPNRGKSVFSEALYLYLESNCSDAWLYDSDGRAPTPPWYLSLVRQDAHAEARTARAASKRDWTPEMQHQIAAQMRRLRRRLAVVIADLPGGDLKSVTPRRLPPGREEIFAEVDAFVLIDRPGEITEALWRAEMRQYGLEGRIAAVLQSSNPKGPPALDLSEEDGLWRGTVTGLDRNRAVTDLIAAFRAPLEQLWPALLKRGRQP